MRNKQKCVHKADSANVHQSYDNQVPRDVCLEVVSGCLFESAIAADRSVCVGWDWGGLQFLKKKKKSVSCFIDQGSPAADIAADAKIGPFDSRFCEICRKTDLTKQFFVVVVVVVVLSPCESSGEWKKTCKHSENIGTNLLELHKWQWWNSWDSRRVCHM